MARPSEHANVYYQQSLDVISVTATTIPIIVAGLGLLARFGVLDPRFYAGDTVYGLIGGGFVLTAVLNFYLTLVRKNSSYPVYLMLTVLFHVLAASFLLFVSGLLSPFLLGWVILVISADLYFGGPGTFISLGTLTLTVIASFILYPFLTPAEQIATLIGFLFVSVTGILMSRLRTIGDRERLALEKTRDQATFQRERLLALVNSMGDAVITTDEYGRIRVYNAATLSLLDTNANLVGKEIDNVLNFRDVKGKRVRIVDDAIKKRMVASRNDLVHKFSNGEIMRLYVNVAPVQPGYRAEGERGFIFILRDITKEKTLENERDEFISVVSHELRTPVAIAEGNLSNVRLLIDRGADYKSTGAAVQAAYDQVMYLSKLINDLGTLSRAERGIGNETEVVDPSQVLVELYNGYLPEAMKKNVQLNLGLGPNLPHVKTSRLYLQEILQNFVTNALKYTRQGSITMNCHVTDKGLLFAVQDTGIGISKSDQAHIFEKFYRSEDYRTRESSGTGLGLYVCKKLADKMGIKIHFESRLNHGSTFSFVVPNEALVRAGQPAQVAAKAPRAASQ